MLTDIKSIFNNSDTLHICNHIDDLYKLIENIVDSNTILLANSDAYEDNINEARKIGYIGKLFNIPTFTDNFMFKENKFLKNYIEIRKTRN